MKNCRSLQQPQFTLGYDFQGYHFCLKGKTKIRPTQGLKCSRKPIIFSFLSSLVFFFFKRAGTNSYVYPLHLYSFTISDENFTVKCILFEDRLIIGKSRDLPFANLLETTVYEKIYVFINPVKYYIFHRFFYQYKHSVHLTIIMQRFILVSNLGTIVFMFKCDVIMLKLLH